MNQSQLYNLVVKLCRVPDSNKRKLLKHFDNRGSVYKGTGKPNPGIPEHPYSNQDLINDVFLDVYDYLSTVPEITQNEELISDLILEKAKLRTYIKYKNKVSPYRFIELYDQKPPTEKENTQLTEIMLELQRERLNTLTTDLDLKNI